jgi:hypothetical protein
MNFTEEKTALKKFIKDLSGQKNFIWFAVMNLIQVFILSPVQMYRGDTMA